MKDNSNEPESPVLTFIKNSWQTTPGKIVITAVAIVGGFGLAGVGLRLAAFAMHGFKDFQEASKR